MGQNSLAYSDVVTFAEVKTMIEDFVKSAVPGDNEVVTQKPTTLFLFLPATVGSPGVTSELDLTAGTAALLSAFGLTGLGTQGGGSEVNGTATTPAPALKIEAGYRGLPSEGLDGNNLSIEVTFDPKFISAGIGNDLASDGTALDISLDMTSLTGIGPGSFLQVKEGSTLEVVKVNTVETVVTGGTVTFTGFAPANHPGLQPNDNYFIAHIKRYRKGH